MKEWALFLGLALFYSVSTQADDRIFSGARNAGTGFSSLTNNGPWELFNNVAGLNQDLNGAYLLSGYSTLFEGTGLKRVYAGLSFPFKKLGLGISFVRTGEKDYHETIAGFAIGNKIRNVSLGVKVNYYQVAVSETGTLSRLVLQFGGIAEISRNFLFGAHIYNLNQAKYSKETGTYLPVLMSAGITWKPLEKIRVNILTEKEGDFNPGVRTGVEYLIEGKLWLRTGLSTHPVSHFAGAGFIHKKYLFDYALKTHSQLGLSHHFTLSILLKGKRK